jgi:hypothetical protein
MPTSASILTSLPVACYLSSNNCNEASNFQSWALIISVPLHTFIIAMPPKDPSALSKTTSLLAFSTDKNFPPHLWDKLLCQAITSLNLL